MTGAGTFARIARAAALLGVLSACGGRVRFEPAERGDTGVASDGGHDAGRDGGRADAAVDAGPDAGPTEPDAALDAGADAARPEDGGEEDAGRADAALDECSAAIGSACDASEPCPDGLVCDQGVCLAPCDATGCCPSEGVGCIEGTEPGTSVCTEGCALVGDTRCAAGLGCRFLRQESTTEVLTFCGSVDDTRADGDPCTRTSECPRGGTCVAAGYCVTFCRVEPGSCGEGRTCLQFVPHARIGAFEYGYCSAACTFVPDAGCVPGTTCLPFVDPRFGEAGYFAQCRVVGPGAEGAPCTSYNDCGAGQVCIESACRALCRLEVAADCPADRGCRAFSPPLETPAGHVGFCSP